jgi:hypothetical protein
MFLLTDNSLGRYWFWDRRGCVGGKPYIILAKIDLFFFILYYISNNSCFHVNIDLLKLLIIKCNEKNAIEKEHENKD